MATAVAAASPLLAVLLLRLLLPLRPLLPPALLLVLLLVLLLPFLLLPLPSLLLLVFLNALSMLAPQLLLLLLPLLALSLATLGGKDCVMYPSSQKETSRAASPLLPDFAIRRPEEEDEEGNPWAVLSGRAEAWGGPCIGTRWGKRRCGVGA